MRHVRLSPPLFAVASVLALACSAPAPRPVVVVGFSADPAVAVPGRVMTSADGETWESPRSIGEGGEWLIEITPRGDGYAAIGLKGGVYLSDGSGAAWTREAVHVSWLDALKFVPSDPSIAYLAGAGAWWRSTDAGATWSQQIPPGYYFEDFAFKDGRRGVGVEGSLEPSRGVVWLTTDGGTAWTGVAETGAGLRAVAAAGDAGAELWAAGDAGTLIVSTDGGARWSDLPWLSLTETPDYTAFDFPTPHAGFLVGSHGVVRAYRAAGPVASRWTIVRTGPFVLQGVFARDAQNAWACGYRTYTDRGVILRTRDGGASWRVEVETPGVFWYGVAGRR